MLGFILMDLIIHKKILRLFVTAIFLMFKKENILRLRLEEFRIFFIDKSHNL